MRTLLALLFSLIASPAFAHPPVSVVVDSKGNLYYSDLNQVWRVAPDDKRSVAVPNVHTHELALDAGDNLYGEDLHYLGERIDKWVHSVWRRSPDGRVTTVIPRREGFLTNYSFVRDRHGTMYWGDRDAGLIRKRLPDGRIVTHARLPKGDLRSMTATPDGTLFFISSGALYRVRPDARIAKLADGLASRTIHSLGRIDRHSIQGLWTDRAGNVYLADYTNRQVRRVTPDGRMTVAATSTAPWSVTGGAFDHRGDLWVLEWAPVGSVRVRRVGAVRAAS